MFKPFLSVLFLASIHAHADTDKLALQSNILKANALTLYASTPPNNHIENITPMIIHSGVVHRQFTSTPSVESQEAIKEFSIDKNNSLIINKEGVAFNVYRYKNEVKILTFKK